MHAEEVRFLGIRKVTTFGYLVLFNSTKRLYIYNKRVVTKFETKQKNNITVGYKHLIVVCVIIIN